MSRSYRHTPICSLAAAASEKEDKRRWHRRFRQRNHQRVCQGTEPLSLTAVSEPWLMAKDGKQWFDRRRHPRLLCIGKPLPTSLRHSPEAEAIRFEYAVAVL